MERYQTTTRRDELERGVGLDRCVLSRSHAYELRRWWSIFIYGFFFASVSKLAKSTIVNPRCCGLFCAGSDESADDSMLMRSIQRWTSFCWLSAGRAVFPNGLRRLLTISLQGSRPACGNGSLPRTA